MTYRRGSLQLPPDPERDERLDRLAQFSGFLSVPALLRPIVQMVSRVPRRQFWRFLGEMERVIERLTGEGRR